MAKKDDIELEIEDVVEEEKATTKEEVGSIKEQTKKTLQKIKENVKEEDPKFSPTMTLRTILGGDILSTQAIRRQVWLILLITFFSILYVSNRYSCQKQQIRIDNLNDELKKSKYKTLSLSSVLTERSRESHVEELLKANSDSTIHAADQPPYIVVVPQSPVK